MKKRALIIPYNDNFIFGKCPGKKERCMKKIKSKQNVISGTR